MRANFLVCTLLSWLQPGEQADKPEGLARYTTTRTKHENSLVLQATLVWRRGHGWNRERKKKLRSAGLRRISTVTFRRERPLTMIKAIASCPTLTVICEIMWILPIILDGNLHFQSYHHNGISRSHRLKLSAHGHAKYIQSDENPKLLRQENLLDLLRNVVQKEQTYLNSSYKKKSHLMVFSEIKKIIFIWTEYHKIGTTHAPVTIRKVNARSCTWI